MEKNSIDNNSISIGDFREILPFGCRFLTVAAIIVIAELCVSWWVLPALAPDRFFLEKYLHSDFEEVNQRFLDGETYLRPDDDVGWINQPSYSSHRWHTDKLGARTTLDDRELAADSPQILMFGSSRVNGGTFLDFSQTISGYLEDQGYSVLNFAAMLHSLDQSLLHFENRLADVRADVVVVEIDEETSPLTNVFIPFRVRQETNMPFLKPRFYSESGQLKVARLPLQSQRTITGLENSLGKLQRIDSSYRNFDLFRRLGVLPISSLVLKGIQKIQNYVALFGHSPDELELQLAILGELNEVAKDRGAILVALNFGMYRAASRKARVYDAVNDSAETLEEALRNMEILYIHVPDVLNASGYSSANLYFPSGVHLLPEANASLAGEIVRVIEEAR